MDNFKFHEAWLTPHDGVPARVLIAEAIAFAVENQARVKFRLDGSWIEVTAKSSWASTLRQHLRAKRGYVPSTSVRPEPEPLTFEMIERDRVMEAVIRKAAALPTLEVREGAHWGHYNHLHYTYAYGERWGKFTLVRLQQGEPFEQAVEAAAHDAIPELDYSDALHELKEGAVMLIELCVIGDQFQAWANLFTPDGLAIYEDLAWSCTTQTRTATAFVS